MTLSITPKEPGEDVPPRDAHADKRLNAIGAAGQSADPNVGRVESGMPVGGPTDLAKHAQDKAKEERE